MARQLPALVSDQRSLSRVGASSPTMSRLIAAVAPDVIRAAERIATQRLQARNQVRPAQPMPEHVEAFHLSEVEIDTSVPFVRRITMRNMTAWQNSPGSVVVDPTPQRSGRGVGRKLGLLGVSSVCALGLGLLARRVAPFGNSDSIIDVTARPKR